ncbi:restriction endonuclease [Sphingobacterium sp.]|uniref:restriction endonuclease n=1 Tax=Sphingobacterium sp. TaxID=341027 RepID=UPI0028A8FB87|nr:restriction endonuclease [Sphingobacterium sp.]
MKQGKEYELLIKEIYDQLAGEAIVKHDDKIYDKSSKSLRQIDVSIRHKLADIDYLTIIEVKDFTHKVGIGIVEAFARVIEDVSANKGIIISAKGFSRHAMEKGKNLGIELLTFHSAKNKNWETIVKAIVHRKTYYFDIDFNINSGFIPVVGGQNVRVDEFFTYNKKDLLSLDEVIIKEIIRKNSLRDLRKSVKIVNLKNTGLYWIVDEKPYKVENGYISAKLLKLKEEIFYINPQDYITKKDHLKNIENVQEMIWDFESLEQLLKNKSDVDNNIVGSPHIELDLYIFSNGVNRGYFKFNVKGGINGVDIFLNNNSILKKDSKGKRILELENNLKSIKNQ